VDEGINTTSSGKIGTKDRRTSHTPKGWTYKQQPKRNRRNGEVGITDTPQPTRTPTIGYLEGTVTTTSITTKIKPT
jgi:hypothetical protein